MTGPAQWPPHVRKAVSMWDPPGGPFELLFHVTGYPPREYMIPLWLRRVGCRTHGDNRPLFIAYGPAGLPFDRGHAHCDTIPEGVDVMLGLGRDHEGQTVFIVAPHTHN